MSFLPLSPRARAICPVLGLLPGEGVGPELISLCQNLLISLQKKNGSAMDVRLGGDIGLKALSHSGRELSQEVLLFCRNIFAEEGAILAGPGGGRFVYDMRRDLDLFVKFNPLRSFPELAGATRLKVSPVDSLDILVVRDNCEGLYQGQSTETFGPEGRQLSHRFDHSEKQVGKLLAVAAEAAKNRRGEMTVIVKSSGLPEVSRLWMDCAEAAARAKGIEWKAMDIDFAAYQFLRHPEQFDVVAVPNCFGDILADLGGVFMGSRGNTYGASYNSAGHGVYQTNHGSAHDLAGCDRANPAGQIFSLAMLLRVAFGWREEAQLLETAQRRVWGQGWRTEDLMEPGTRLLGTLQMGERVLAEIDALELSSCA